MTEVEQDLYVDNAMTEILRFNKGELNDTVTRAAITNILRSHLDLLLLPAKVRVVCNEMNNPPVIIDSNDLVLDVYVDYGDDSVRHYSTSWSRINRE